MVELEWAYDMDGKHVNINDSNVKNYELKQFRCIICNKELIAKPKGEEKAPHFAHKEKTKHEPSQESNEHLNAKLGIWNSLEGHLNKQPFYVGVYLDSDFNSPSIKTNRKIQRINILKNVDRIECEKVLENGYKPDISLFDKNGKAIRTIEIVKSHETGEDKIEDLEDIEIIEVKIESPAWTEYELHPENEIKFFVNNSDIHYPSVKVCKELICGNKYCITDTRERLHCNIKSDSKDKIFDFEKCLTYTGQNERRCSFTFDSVDICNRMLLKTEEEYCERCLKKIEENKRKEEREKRKKQEEEDRERDRNEIEKLEEEKRKKDKIEEERFAEERWEKEKSEIEKLIQPGIIPADRIYNLDLPISVKKFYIKSGINRLYPPQYDAIKAGLLDGKNIVAAIPTASGKTLLAEFAMLKSILDENKKGKALYIVPLRALASEKYDRFRSFGIIKKSNDRDVSTGIATGDFDASGDWLGDYDIIVATSEKVDSLLRFKTRWLEEITVLIADEIHLIDSPDRGPTLEIVLAKLRQINPDMQIIALSATIGNANEIAKWLDANLVVSNWRPTELKEGVFFGNAITFANRSQRAIEEFHKDSVISLAADTIKEGGQCLIFESSRKNSEGMAARVGTSISKLISGDVKEKLKKLAAEINETSEVESTRKLAMCVENGSAFHHAGLISEQRKIVENGFRAGIIKVISSTPTLAAGLNLPARRVIIKGYWRYDVNFGQTPIPVLEYKQMAGRAGRPRLDPYGESVLVAKTFDDLEELMKQYVLADVEKIWSKLGSENALRTHILSTIATGFAQSMEELLEFMRATFYSTQQEPWSLKAVIEKVIDFLVEKKFIKKEKGLSATNLGELVSRLYIDPLSASMILEGMGKIEEKSIQFTDLTLLHLACRTPDMRQLYLRSNDYEWLSDLIMEHHAEFVDIPAQFKVDYEWFLSEVKTACVMLDWINEKKEEDIVKKFGIGEGDIRALSETALWLVHSMAELGRHEKRSCAKAAAELEKRVEYGASPELLDLIQIRGIGRVRARKLFNAGIRDMQTLRVSDLQTVSKIIGPKVAVKILKQIGTSVIVEERTEEQRSLGDFS